MAASRILSLSQKIIKPSFPTPSSLKRHNLSFLDQISLSIYAPIAAFYSKPANNNISQILENSLSKVLSSYYPFAGRIKDNKYVDCNDVGVQYSNVRVNCPMSEILNHPYNDATDRVFPQDLPWSSSLDQIPLVVQLSHFDCGGIAISICISHKIADGYSLSKFLNDWAATTRELDFKPSTQFDAASFFPPMDDPPVIPDVVREQCVSRMFNISSYSLGKLKDIVSINSEVQNPTRIEVATALIHKCGVAVSMANSGLFRPSLVTHLMNLHPHLPLHTIGNAYCFLNSATTTADEIQLPRVVAKLRKAKQHQRDKLKDMSPDKIALHALESINAGVNIIIEKKYDPYMYSSLCNLGLYKIDFGWGKPISVTLARSPMKNNIVFLDDPSGEGINALITLTEADMLIFQSNKELLEFASPVVYSPERGLSPYPA